MKIEFLSATLHKHMLVDPIEYYEEVKSFLNELIEAPLD
jgi:hypothetical protein